MGHLIYPRTRFMAYWCIIYFFFMIYHRIFRLWFYLGGQMSFWGVTCNYKSCINCTYIWRRISNNGFGWPSVGLAHIKTVFFC